MTTSPSIKEAVASELGVNRVWEPIPGSSQEIALDTRCHHTLYHGSRGPGKTVTQLMRFRRRVGLGYGSYWRGVIFDREFKNLADLVAQSKRFFSQFNDGAKFLESASEYKWVWPTGEELLFRHIKKLSDYDGFHGHEYPFIGWNELTKWATSELYDKMMSCNRSSFTPEKDTPKITDRTGTFVEWATFNKEMLPPIPLEVFSTTNSSGVGHHWVKDRFIEGIAPGEVVETETEVFSPRTKELVKVIKTQVAIFGSYKENIYLSDEYIVELNNQSDPNLRRSWLTGSWDITAGGALDDLWDSDIHIVPRFVIPSSWYINRSFDWGSSHPFSVGWWAESDGTEATIVEGDRVYKWAPAAGSLIRFFEWYGTEKIGTNKGLKLSAGTIAQGIVDREISLMANGWIHEQPKPGPADNQIDQVREADVDTIKKKMNAKGVDWTVSEKSPGSRVIRLELFRERLLASIKGEGAGIYFMRNCKAATKILPTLPRDEIKIDDVDTTSEDHIYDESGYRVLQGSDRITANYSIKMTN